MQLSHKQELLSCSVGHGQGFMCQGKWISNITSETHELSVVCDRKRFLCFLHG